MQKSKKLRKGEQIKGIIFNLGNEPAKVFLQNEIQIGRNRSDDIRLYDKSVSSKQSRIYYLNDTWMIEDLQSENGTYLNDQRILKPTTLKENDIVRCGKIELRITFQN